MALSTNEITTINKMLVRLADYGKKNQVKDNYLDAKTTIKGLNTSNPEKQQAFLNTVSGWGKTIVNTKSSRVQMDRVDVNGLEDLDKILKENRFVQKTGQVQKDCFIYGTAYMMVGRGQTAFGEPEILVTMESPYTTLGTENLRTGRLDSLLKVYFHENKVVAGSLYTLSEVIYFDVEDAFILDDYDGSALLAEPHVVKETKREVHNQGFIPAVRIAHDVRASDRSGKSLFSSSTRYFIDMINRTFNDLEWSNSLYAFPKRYATDVILEQFKNPDGTTNKAAVSSFMKDMWMFGRNEKGGYDAEAGPSTKVGQLDPSSPEPYVEVIRLVEAQLAREHSIPEYYLNAGNNVPTAAEAMEASEHPLNLAIQEIQGDFANAYLELFRIIMLMKRGSVPEEFAEVDVEWRDTSTVSITGRADAVSKLVESGAINSKNPALQTFIPWNPTQRKAIEAWQTAPDTTSDREALAKEIRAMGQQAQAIPQIAENVDNVTGE